MSSEDLTDTEVQLLAASFQEITYGSDECVFRHGDTACAFYVVRRGAVALFRDQVGKPIQLLARYVRGEHFGELGLFDARPRQATARTTEPTHLLEIEAADLIVFLESHPSLALKLHTTAARRHTENVAAVLGIGARDEVRIRVGRQVRMTDATGGLRDVILETLSKGGLSLRGAPAAWLPKTRVRFSLDLAGESLEVLGRVSWRSGGALGLAFEERAPNHEDRIQQALRRLLHEDSMSGTFQRP